MQVIPVRTPRDEAGIRAAVELLSKAAKAAEFALEPEGLVRALVNDTMRLVVAVEADTAVGLAAMAYGTRWFDPDMTATIVFAEGRGRAEMLQYLRNMAEMVGARRVFYEHAEGDTLGGQPSGAYVLEL